MHEGRPGGAARRALPRRWLGGVEHHPVPADSRAYTRRWTARRGSVAGLRHARRWTGKLDRCTRRGGNALRCRDARGRASQRRQLLLEGRDRELHDLHPLLRRLETGRGGLGARLLRLRRRLPLLREPPQLVHRRLLCLALPLRGLDACGEVCILALQAAEDLPHLREFLVGSRAVRFGPLRPLAGLVHHNLRQAGPAR